ncbi:MAG: ABC transporter permease [Lewinellaceae bacterium]|nr:ABC transporter permease [Lewinellaceae bacterium]
MNISSSIAYRYLISKKSTNVINIITWISVVGLAIGTAALILILSVFNGFESLLTGMLSNFNPDIKIIPNKGKYINVDSSLYRGLMAIDGVDDLSMTIEETAFFTYNGSQEVGILKGVDAHFKHVSGIDSSMISGDYGLDEKKNAAVLGSGMATKLSINQSDIFSPVEVYVISNLNAGPLEKEYDASNLYPTGNFSVGNDIDMQYVLVNKAIADSLLNKSNVVSAYEIKLKQKDNAQKVKKTIQSLISDRDLKVNDRYDQDAEFLKIMNIEKWVSYLIVSLTMFIIAFNMIGSLWMIVLEKKLDIAILKSIGFTKYNIKSIFIRLGLFMAGFGILIGILIALILYYLQITFGLVKVPEGFLIDAYPIELRIIDFIVVVCTVFVIGYIASLIPAIRASKIGTYVRQE